VIVAEVGQNFCGRIELAQTLIELAYKNGADLAKFQLYDHNQLYKDHPEIPNVELSFDQAKMLFDYGAEIGIEVFFSVFDIERVKWCEEIGVKRYKVGARNGNKSLWAKIAETGKPTIISYDPDYEKWGFPSTWKILYCVSSYPAKVVRFNQGMFEDVGDEAGSSDGRAEYHKEYDGFSDHTIGLDATMIALARGAEIIEKHFTISHGTGIDAEWSMTPGELRALKRWEQAVKKIL